MEPRVHNRSNSQKKSERTSGKQPAKATRSVPLTQHPPKPAARSKASGNSKQAHRKPSGTTKKPLKPLSKAKQVADKTRPKAKQTAPRTESQYQAKPERFKETWDRVLSVISKMRSDKVSLTKASHDTGISPRTVTKWGKSALRKQKSGKYAAKISDNLLRLITIPTPQGRRDIAVRGSKQASLLGEYWNALHWYLQTGNATRLKAFQGKHITDANGVDVPLSIDLAELNRLGSAGVLSFESLYARTT